MIKLRSNKKVKGKFCSNQQILQFPKREEIISDEDIMDLFKGLIELIKKNTELRVEKKYEYMLDVLKKELQVYRSNN